MQAAVIADTTGADADTGERTSLRAAPIVPAQLPPDAAGFVGRGTYLRRLDAMLVGGEAATATAVCVLTGAAGVGKTTLAVRWARKSVERFPDGQLFMDMRGFHTGPRMTGAEALPLLLVALGVTADGIPIGIDAQTALYRSLLAGRRVLVVLDNVADADQARPLIPGDPGCLVLVTSRDRLSGLVALDGAHRLTVEVLPAGDAIAVLARAAGADRFDADPRAVAELAELCGRLPLALRIAGARLADRPHLGARRQVEEWAARGRMAELRVDGDANATVRGAFDLSYQALTDSARRVFRLIGLVPAPAGMDIAAVAALAGLPGADVEPLVDALARFHLVRIAADGRLAAHDLLLEYAAALAAEHDEPVDRDDAVDRLLTFYVHTADRAGKVLSGSQWLSLPPDPLPAGVVPVTFTEQSQARRWSITQWMNLVAAVDHASASGRDRTAWQLVHALRPFMQLQAPIGQALSITHTGLAAARRAGDVLGEAMMRHSMGYLRLARTAEFQAAIAEYEILARLSAQAGWQRGQIAALCDIGIALDSLGQMRPAIRRLEQALAMIREVGDEEDEVLPLTNLAGFYEAVGDLTRALRTGERALSLLRRTGQRQGEVVALLNLAKVHRHQGRLPEALELLHESLAISRAIGARHEEVDALVTIGMVQGDGGRCEAATAALAAGLDTAEQLSDSRLEIYAHIGLAVVEIRQGHLDDAAKRLDGALETVERIGYHRRRFETLLTLSELHAALGDHHSGYDYATRALILAGGSGHKLAVGQAQGHLAVSLIGLDRPAEALEQCRLALVTQRRAGQRLVQARTLLTAGRAYQRLGKTGLARSRWRQAHVVFTEVGAPERETTVALLA